MNSISKLLKEFLAMIFGYTLYNVEFGGVHYCFSYSEAMEWMKCYPVGSFTVLYHGKNLIQSRG